MQWTHPEQKTYHDNLRNLSVGVMSRPGARQSQRYWGKDLPDLKNLVQTVHMKCKETLQKFSDGRIAIDERDHLQQCIIVGLQVLIPPMRGKPFYTLESKDSGTNSMAFPFDVRISPPKHVQTS